MDDEERGGRKKTKMKRSRREGDQKRGNIAKRTEVGKEKKQRKERGEKRVRK